MIVRALVLLALLLAFPLTAQAQEDPFTAAENAPGFWVPPDYPSAAYDAGPPPAYYYGPAPVYYGPGIYFGFGFHGHHR
jgi:hypothetical protein